MTLRTEILCIFLKLYLDINTWRPFAVPQSPLLLEEFPLRIDTFLPPEVEDVLNDWNI